MTADPQGEAKAQARALAFARRAEAHRTAHKASARLSEVLEAHRGVPLAGYAAMRTEIDPLPALREGSAFGPVGLPVILRPASPLSFRLWTPDSTMVAGTFSAPVPRDGGDMTPRILIVPLVAFDRAGGRLGYGGGFYDRTLERLRAQGPTLAIGFAYAAQEADRLPQDPTDQPLDLIVTETEVIVPT